MKKRTLSKAVREARELVKMPLSREELFEAAYQDQVNRMAGFLAVIEKHFRIAAGG